MQTICSPFVNIKGPELLNKYETGLRAVERGDPDREAILVTGTRRVP
jgi:hypothetical protein